MTDMNNTIKLPEPAGVVGVMPGTSGFTTAIFKANEVPVGTHLYTEQQVRELLDKAACTKSQNQEPFGYFKRDSYGWMDCSKDTKGAVALYEAPQPQADALDAQRYRWLIDYFISDRVDLDDALVAAKSTDEISKIIDAAIASKGDSA